MSTVCSIYDTLRLIVPVVLVVKRILQQICADHAGWDDPIQAKVRVSWDKWRQDLRLLEAYLVVSSLMTLVKFLGCYNGQIQSCPSESDDSSKIRTNRSTGCDFHFKMNVPAASHMGGSWERQIRSIRNVLASLMNQCGSHVDDEQLRTFMCEAANIVKGRPLSVESINDPEPLSPQNLLTLKTK
ncbi:LOW QUALITY PROTEIN: hypothetical protein MAR_027829, partial [Mya arenaria]